MKPIYLLDTNVISEFTKRKPNKSVMEKIIEHDGLCAICSTVWQESIFGLTAMPEGRRKKNDGRLSSGNTKIFRNYSL